MTTIRTMLAAPVLAVLACGADAVYALELPEGDRGLPKAQRAARRELRHFLHSLDASFRAGTLVTR